MGERFKFEGSVKRDIQSLRSDNVSPTRKSSSKRQRRYQRPEHIFDPEEDPKLQATLLRERRAMLIITAISIVCIFLFLVAMATNYWLWAIFRHKMTDSEGQMVNVTTQLWIGIWNEYRQRTFDNGTQVGKLLIK